MKIVKNGDGLSESEDHDNTTLGVAEVTRSLPG
jgi:hypothetical protein